MESDIKSFIEEIISNTNLDLCVYDADRQFVCGDEVKGEVIPEINGVNTDVALNRTFFNFNYKNKNYVGRIKGASKNEVNFAYLIAELSQNATGKTQVQTREDFFKALILGEVSSIQIEKNIKKYGLINKQSCVMIIGLKKGFTDEVISIIQTYETDKGDIAFKYDDSHCAFIKFSDEATGEYRSFTEYAEFLQGVIYEEVGEKPLIAIGGTVKSIENLSVSFSQALSALRMRASTNFGNGVCSFKDFILVKMLEDLPKYKLSEYLDLLMSAEAKEIFQNSEMLLTAEAFLDNNLNVSETSRVMYLHRNTLNYRLDKIERATGLDLRKFSDATTFRLISFLSKTVR